MRERRGARAILWGGLAAGILDLAAALVLYGLRGARPIRILQAISSGVLGAAAFQGGAATAALGVALHFLIAFGAAAVYFAASWRLASLVRHAVPWGLAYGVGVYLFMNTVVLPLSAVARRPFAPDPTLVLVHMLFVGLPIALAVRRYAPGSAARRAA